MTSGDGEIILYRTEDGRSQIQLRAADGTVWLTQAQMAELFATTVQNVQQRISAILEDGELTEATINSELIVRQEGARQVRREVPEWVEATDRFIHVNDMKVLSGAGRISSEQAAERALAHFASFDAQRRELETTRADQEAAREMRELVEGGEERLLGDLERIEEEIERRRGQSGREGE